MTMGEEQHTSHDVHHHQQEQRIGNSSAAPPATVLSADNGDYNNVNSLSSSLLEPPSSPPARSQSRTVPSTSRDWRRRSADVGGLHLATMGLGQGQGWMGGDPLPIETIYAELLSDMYNETMNSVNDHSLDSVPDALPDSVRSRLIHSLSRWHFEPNVLPDEEVLACTIILFETLFRIQGMSEVIPVNMRQIIGFLHHLRRIYRYENTYHNFEHALDVLQATHCYLKSAGMVPPPTILFVPNQLWKPQKEYNSGSLVSCLGLRELFVLYIAAIGHDVGHPGLTNMFMKNANTPLSLLFDHTSALEQMHYQLLKRVMRHHGLGVFLDDPLHGTHVRDILRSSVIFTDMSVHNDFMAQFKKLIEGGGGGSISQRQTIICQALLKNADISNPSRPFYVSTRWAKALMQEWKAQANLEEEYDLKPSVMSSTDPIKEAESQIFFISHFLKPMLQLTVKAVPEMSCYLNHLKSNLRTWVKRKDELSKQQQEKQPPRTVVVPPLPPQVPQTDEETLVNGTGTNGSAVGPPTPALATPCAITDHHSPHSSQSPLPASFVSFSFQNGIAASPPPPPLPPRMQADSFVTAFPLTLPTYPPKKYNTTSVGGWIRPTSSSSSASSSSSRSVSEHEAGLLNSPSVESTSDFHASHLQQQVFSPISEARSVGDKNSQTINYHRPAHRCRSNSSVSNSSMCDQCGASFNPPSISSPGPPTDSNHVFRIWCSPTQFSTTSVAGEAADDDDDDDGDDENGDEKHASAPHAAIRNASLLGSLRQRRQKDVSGVVSLKDFIAGVDRSSKTANTMGGVMLPNAKTKTTMTRRAVRYSWCAGMAGLNGGAAFRQYQNGVLSDNGGGSWASSPEIPSVSVHSSSYADDASSTTSDSVDEDETVTSHSTSRTTTTRTLSQLSGSFSIRPSPTMNSTTDPVALDSIDTSSSMARLSSPSIKFQPLRVRSA